jgi:DNA-binding NarL/FixJ family response regulator
MAAWGPPQIIAQASTVADAITEAARANPEVIVMDVRLPDGSGIEASREIRETQPETKVIILTSCAMTMPYSLQSSRAYPGTC